MITCEVTVCTSDGTATITLADDGGDVYPAIVGADAIRAVPTGISCSGVGPSPQKS